MKVIIEWKQEDAQFELCYKSCWWSSKHVEEDALVKGEQN